MGSNHLMILMENGDVFAWGSGIEGQLGMKVPSVVCKPSFNSFSLKIQNQLNEDKENVNDNMFDKKQTSE